MGYFNIYFLVDTGGEWGPNALRTIDPIKDKLRIIRYSDLESSPFEWPDLSLQDPEQLTYQQKRFHLKDHQKEVFDDVTNGFKASDRGKLIMACGTGKAVTAPPNPLPIISTGMSSFISTREVDGKKMSICPHPKIPTLLPMEIPAMKDR